MKTQRVTIANREGLELSAQLELPLGEQPRAFAIFAHCFTCGKNLKGEHHIALALTQQRIAVLRFDFAGIGESDGEFFDTNFSTNVNDLIDVAQWLEREHQAPQLLVGHSLGGAAVIVAASALASVRAVVTVGAPAEPAHVKRLFAELEHTLRQEGSAEVKIGGRPFVLKKHFLDSIESVSMADLLPKLGKALLVMHAPGDQVVGIYNARKIYDAARHPKSFISLDGADHLLLRSEDSLYAGHMMGHWASRYLDLGEDKPLVTDKQAVVRIGSTGFTTEVRAGDHTLLADEPRSVGGDNFGPTPYDLLVASLGTCTAMTMRMYADRKKWPVEEIRVHLQHEQVYAQDALDADEQARKIDRIQREIEIDGPLDDSQRAKLLEIADKCPVHRTLHNDLSVETSLRRQQGG